jgi:hypothetical protein
MEERKMFSYSYDFRACKRLNLRSRFGSHSEERERKWKRGKCLVILTIFGHVND